MKRILDWVSRVTDEYNDTLALFFIAGGSLTAAVSIGTLPGSGSYLGQSFVYMKHPVYLHIGLLAIVIGFVLQLYDNLTKTHKLGEKKAYVLASVVFVYLILYVLLS